MRFWHKKKEEKLISPSSHVPKITGRLLFCQAKKKIPGQKKFRKEESQKKVTEWTVIC